MPIDEPGAPNAATNDRDDADVETAIDREKASKLISDEVAMRVPIRAEDLRKLNAECRQEEQEARVAARRSRRRRGKIGILGSRKMPAPSWDRQASCDDDQILRNEANVEFVSGPLSVVSGPLSVVICTAEAPTEAIAMSEPPLGPLSDVSRLSSVASDHFEASAGPDETNERVDCPSPVVSCMVDSTNEPELGAGGQDGKSVELVPGINDVSLHSTLTAFDREELEEHIERIAVRKRLSDEVARREMIRAENVRKFDQQWWNEAEAAELACRARGRGHQNGNPGGRETSGPGP